MNRCLNRSSPIRVLRTMAPPAPFPSSAEYRPEARSRDWTDSAPRAISSLPEDGSDKVNPSRVQFVSCAGLPWKCSSPMGLLSTPGRTAATPWMRCLLARVVGMESISCSSRVWAMASSSVGSSWAA